ncbi:MAG: TlpA family protein disulfide reductase, partial [Crocinitomicaceae bacterium]|nr:TlpA family protein disulfide reductase [Crocinitomicaceae bacterium]
MKLFIPILSLAFIFCLSSNSFAQFNNWDEAMNDMATDFTATDLDGNTHNLFTYLDQGKTVIIEYYAHWCTSCPTNVPVLEQIWNDHGPAGDNTIMVLHVEYDYGSSDSLALSTTSWGINSPIINATSSNPVPGYGMVGGFPTTVVICPQRNYTTTGYLYNFSDIAPQLASCPVLTSATVDARIAYFTSDEVNCSYSVQPLIQLQNLGTDPLTTVDIVAKVDGTTIYTHAWTGNLNTYEYDNVPYPIINYGQGASQIEFTVENPNGITDQVTSNDSFERSIPQIGTASGENLFMELLTDNYASETTWEFMDQSSNVLYSGGPYTDEIQTTIYETFNMTTSGCYDLWIYDTYGDGISSPYGWVELS